MNKYFKNYRKKCLKSGKKGKYVNKYYMTPTYYNFIIYYCVRLSISLDKAISFFKASNAS